MTLRIDPQRACDQFHGTDQARTAYLRHFYGADLGNPRLYHLIIDTTVVPPQAAADAIVVAATAIATHKANKDH
jgi:cytidylate kinase